MGKNTKEISKAKNAGKASKKAGKVKGKKPAAEKAGPNPVKEWSKYGIPVSTRLNGAEDGKMAGKFARVTIFGHSLSSVLAAARKADLTPSEMRKALNAIGLTAVASSQIADKMGSRYAARIEAGSGQFAPLGKAEIVKLRKAAEIESK